MRSIDSLIYNLCVDINNEENAINSHDCRFVDYNNEINILLSLTSNLQFRIHEMLVKHYIIYTITYKNLDLKFTGFTIMSETLMIKVVKSQQSNNEKYFIRQDKKYMHHKRRVACIVNNAEIHLISIYKLLETYSLPTTS